MIKLVKACASQYGARTCIYSYINPNYIVELGIVQTQHEINIEALMSNGDRVIIMYKDDLKEIVGEERYNEIMEEIEERAKNIKEREW